MKKIKLTQGRVCKVDDEDYNSLIKFKWQGLKLRHTTYARTGIHKGYKDGKRLTDTILMHRLIMNAPQGLQVDHIDHDGLNNQKNNLRLCKNSENQMNQGVCKNNKSGYKGVSFNKRRSVWLSFIHVNNKTKYLGSFKSPENAAIAYNIFAEKHYGEFAHLNTTQ